MRNLKKTLCLVLALVFVLGLCTVGAADADFSDAADIDAKYVDAVKVLSGLKILTGYPEGDFRPEKEVTRAEAATIIARICLGVENAGLYPARATFSDVSKDHFASRAINYCVNNGIINGYGDGTFRPSKPVTQAQLCKMLLAAVGYGQNGEFTGSEWDANVAEIAFKTKILKNLQALDWDAAATREETSLLGYNTLMSVDQVKYSKDSSSYTPVGSAGSSTISDDAVWNMNSATGIVLKNKASGALLTVLDSGLEVTTDSDADAALLGHKIMVRYSKDDKVAYYVEDLSTEEAYSAAMDAAIASANSGTRYYWTDGVKANTAYPSGKGTPGTFILDEKRIIIGYKAVETIFLAELYKTKDGKWAVNENKTERLLTLVPDGAAEKDIVTVKHLDTAYSAYANTKEEGVLVTQMASTADSWNNGAIKVTTAGACYDKAGNKVAMFAADGTLKPAAKTTYTIYKDCLGGTYKVEKTAEEKVPENDGYLVDMWKISGGTVQNGAFEETTPDTYYAQVVMSDGTRKELVIGKDNGTLTGITDKDASLTKGAVYLVKENATTGIATLTEIKDGKKVQDYYKASFTAGAFPTDARIDFSKATYIQIVGSGSKLTPVLTATIDKKKAAGAYIYGEIKNGATTVYEVVAVWYDTAVDTTTKTDYIYVATGKVSETKIDADGISYNYYVGYKNGVAMTDLKVAAAGDDGTAIPKAGFYTGYTISTKDGTYDLSKGPETTTVKDLDLSYQGSVTGTEDNYILNGKLYSKAYTPGLDLSKAVIIDNTMHGIKTVEELENAMVTAGEGKKFSIQFVLAGGDAKFIGGDMIILTAYPA